MFADFDRGFLQREPRFGIMSSIEMLRSTAQPLQISLATFYEGQKIFMSKSDF